MLGGGIDTITLASFPGPVQVSLALRVVFEGVEIVGEHALAVDLTDSDQTPREERLDATFELSAPGEGAELDQRAISLSIGLSAELPQPGVYWIRARVDDVELVRLPLTARIAPPERTDAA